MDTAKNSEECSFTGCARVRRSKSQPLCTAHYNQQRTGKTLKPLGNYRQTGCEFEGCTNKHMAKGLCAGHYQQNKRGVPLSDLQERHEPTPCESREPKEAEVK